MQLEDVFCAKCGRQLDKRMFIGEKTVKFKDGEYCLACAKAEIAKQRKQN